MIYIPVEAASREIFGKSLLAYYLASKNNTVYLYEHTFFDRYGWPQQGTFIGKNCFRTEVTKKLNISFYKEMKKKKIKVFLLDEEGAIYPGEKKNFLKILLKRTYLKFLQKNDKVLCWGSFQKKLLEGNKKKIPIEVTGHPVFESLKPEYSDIFKKIDLEITGSRRDYILINTKFSSIMPKRGFEGYLGESSGNANSYEQSLPEFEEAYYVIPNFLKLIIGLVKKNSNNKFIIRPHPEEKKDIYEYIFKNFKNVEIINNGPVDSWIRQSKLVITWGCTTALQSYIARKKILIFDPDINIKSKIKNYFVNDLGIRVSSLKEISKAMKQKKKETNLHLKFVSNINTFEKIFSLINEKKSNKPENFRLMINGFYENIKFLVKKLLSIGKFHEEYFKYFYLVNSIIEKANKKNNTNVRIKKISKYVYKIYI